MSFKYQYLERYEKCIIFFEFWMLYNLYMLFIYSIYIFMILMRLTIIVLQHLFVVVHMTASALRFFVLKAGIWTSAFSCCWIYSIQFYYNIALLFYYWAHLLYPTFFPAYSGCLMSFQLTKWWFQMNLIIDKEFQSSF